MGPAISGETEAKRGLQLFTAGLTCRGKSGSLMRGIQLSRARKRVFIITTDLKAMVGSNTWPTRFIASRE